MVSKATLKPPSLTCKPTVQAALAYTLLSPPDHRSSAHFIEQSQLTFHTDLMGYSPTRILSRREWQTNRIKRWLEKEIAVNIWMEIRKSSFTSAHVATSVSDLTSSWRYLFSAGTVWKYLSIHWWYKKVCGPEEDQYLQVVTAKHIQSGNLYFTLTATINHKLYNSL